MAWMCTAEKHEMVKPNLYYVPKPLDRKPKTDAEKRTGQRWEPHCRACEDAALPKISFDAAFEGIDIWELS